MANTRQQIVDALEERMQDISGVTTAEVWRTIALEARDLPAIVVRDGLDQMPSDGVSAARRDHELAVEIELYFSGSTSAADARDMVASVVAAIGTDKTFGDLAFDTIIASADINMETADRVYASAQIELSIRYRTELWSI